MIARLATALLCVSASSIPAYASAESSFLKAPAQGMVQWAPWSDEIWTRAATEQKPLYVFIGAFTNELSRAMDQQSFANPKVAALLNENFICVKVDRDAHPEIAAFAQAYLQAVKQTSGWPVNLWLTPQGLPFEGATYLPPSEEWGKEGIQNVLQRILNAKAEGSAGLETRGAEAIAAMEANLPTQAPAAWNAAKAKSLEDSATQAWLQTFDSEHGGFGEAPRYPEPELLRFLLTSPGPGREAALKTLHSVRRSALHDPLDGGFFRRSIDAAWRIPSLQKLAGDQARIALALLDAAQLDKDPSLGHAAASALHYAVARLQNPEGAFSHAEDSTPDALAGPFAWSPGEIEKALGAEAAREFNTAFSVSPAGNVSEDNDPAGRWKGRTVLSSVPDGFEVSASLRQSLQTLLDYRDTHARPLRDENVLIGENGLLLFALVKGAQQLGDTALAEAAKRSARFLLAHATNKEGAVIRLYGSDIAGSADDALWVAAGLQAYGEQTQDGKASDLAQKLWSRTFAEHYDDTLGRFRAAPLRASKGWIRPLPVPVLAGDLPSAETVAALVHRPSLGELPGNLAAVIGAELDDPAGQPRGDTLLAAHALRKP